MEYLQYSKIKNIPLKKPPTKSVFIITTYLNKPHSENNAITTNGNNDSNGLRGGHGFDPDGGHG